MSRPIAFPRSVASRARQSGVALMVVLILLVLMTLLALVSLRGTLMQERMSSSQYDRSLAFQAAEAALREAEATAGKKPDVPDEDCDTATGVCAEPVPGEAQRWLASNWDSISKEASDASLGDLAVKPRYIIEYMGLFPGKNCTTSGDVSEASCSSLERHYRITARSHDGDRADVTLQSNYAVP
jgi:type IV pilus assembly protein PilX